MQQYRKLQKPKILIQVPSFPLSSAGPNTVNKLLGSFGASGSAGSFVAVHCVVGQYAQHMRLEKKRCKLYTSFM